MLAFLLEQTPITLVSGITGDLFLSFVQNQSVVQKLTYTHDQAKGFQFCEWDVPLNSNSSDASLFPQYPNTKRLKTKAKQTTLIDYDTDTQSETAC